MWLSSPAWPPPPPLPEMTLYGWQDVKIRPPPPPPPPPHTHTHTVDATTTMFESDTESLTTWRSQQRLVFGRFWGIVTQCPIVSARSMLTVAPLAHVALLTVARIGVTTAFPSFPSKLRTRRCRRCEIDTHAPSELAPTETDRRGCGKAEAGVCDENPGSSKNWVHVSGLPRPALDYNYVGPWFYLSGSVRFWPRWCVLWSGGGPARPGPSENVVMQPACLYCWPVLQMPFSYLVFWCLALCCRSIELFTVLQTSFGYLVFWCLALCCRSPVLQTSFGYLVFWSLGPCCPVELFTCFTKVIQVSSLLNCSSVLQTPFRYLVFWCLGPCCRPDELFTCFTNAVQVPRLLVPGSVLSFTWIVHLFYTERHSCTA